MSSEEAQWVIEPMARELENHKLLRNCIDEDHDDYVVTWWLSKALHRYIAVVAKWMKDRLGRDANALNVKNVAFPRDSIGGKLEWASTCKPSKATFPSLAQLTFNISVHLDYPKPQSQIDIASDELVTDSANATVRLTQGTELEEWSQLSLAKLATEGKETYHNRLAGQGPWMLAYMNPFWGIHIYEIASETDLCIATRNMVFRACRKITILVPMSYHDEGKQDANKYATGNYTI